MNELDLTRRAVESLGEAATPAEIAAFARDHLGGHLDPRFVSLYRATLRGLEQQRQARENAARILEEGRREEPVKKRAKAALVAEDRKGFR